MRWISSEARSADSLEMYDFCLKTRFKREIMVFLSGAGAHSITIIEHQYIVCTNLHDPNFSLRLSQNSPVSLS